MPRINKIHQATQLNRDELFRYGPVERLLARLIAFRLADGRAATVSSTQRRVSLP